MKTTPTKRRNGIMGEVAIYGSSGGHTLVLVLPQTQSTRVETVCLIAISPEKAAEIAEKWNIEIQDRSFKLTDNEKNDNEPASR